MGLEPHKGNHRLKDQPVTDRIRALFKRESTKITEEFAKAIEMGKGTSQEIADFKESAIRSIISRYFPFPYKIAKVQIIDIDNNHSASVDCILLSPDHPLITGFENKYDIVLSDGVECGIEIKSNIGDTKELESLLRQSKSVKLLNRKSIPGKERASKIPYICFAMELSGGHINLANKIDIIKRSENEGYENLPDAIFIHNIGALYINYNKDSRYLDDMDCDSGMMFIYWGENTLGAMIWYLSSVPSLSLKWRDSLMTPYIKKIVSPMKWTAIIAKDKNGNSVLNHVQIRMANTHNAIHSKNKIK